MVRSSIMLAMITAGVMLFVGCADNMINVAGATLTSGANMSQGKRTATSQFTHDDFIVMLVDFT